jgi:tRNA A37 methylthiotransferase MiaB
LISHKCYNTSAILPSPSFKIFGVIIITSSDFAFDVVDEITKRKRVNDLLELNNKQALRYREKFLGKAIDVLVEKNVKGICFGHTSNYLEVEFKDNNAKENDLIKVEITEVNYPKCIGRRI